MMMGSPVQAWLELCSPLGEGGIAPSRINLTAGSILVGRGSDKFPVNVTVLLRHNGKDIISRQHMRITKKQGEEGYCAEDMKALNGVFVNNVRIEKKDLNEGDILQMGGVSNIPIGEKLSTDELCCVRYRYHAPAAFVNGGSSSSSSSSRNNQNVGNGTGNDRKRSSDSIQQLCAAAPVSKRSTPPPLAPSTNGEQSAALQKQSQHYSQQHLQQALDLQEQELNSMRQLLAAAREEKADALAAAQRKDELVASLRLQLDEALRAGAASSSSSSSSSSGRGAEDKAGCEISTQSLRECLICPVCAMPVLDAVVMRCSHTFCRSCLEAHLHRLPLKCTCPICNDPPPKAAGSSQQRLLYFRSAFLDHLAWLLNEASGPKEKQAFLEREKHSRVALKALGIDPDSNEGVLPSESQSQSQHSASTSSTVKKSTHARGGGAGLLCDYCGERHEGTKCPHDNGDGNDEEAEDDDDGSQDV